MRRWVTWFLMAAAIVVVAVTQLLSRLDDPPPPFNDPAIRNIVTLVALLIAGAAGWIWFVLNDRFSWRIRWTFGIVTVLAFVIFINVISALHDKGVLNFSGSLMPRIATSPRETIEVSKESAPSRADFSRISPVDFAQFLGPDRDGSIESAPLARDWQSQPPRRIWQRSIGAGWSGFASVNGYAVTMEQRGDQECVVCYAADTGQPVWSHALTARHETTLGGVGPRCTPTIHAGCVYALGATGVLRCLDESGQMIWSDDLRSRYNVTAHDDEQLVMFGRSASPLVVDNMVVVPGGGPQGRAKNLVAFDRLTGQLIWESECELPSDGSDQISYASPALATIAGRTQILIVNESTASGHDPATGQLLWSYAWPGKSNGNASVSQMVVVPDNRLLLSKGYGEGAELIEVNDSGDDKLNVARVWKVARVLQTKFSNVVVRAGHAYGLSEGILECVVLETGQRRWKKGRYGHGQILSVNDLLLILSEDGELHLVEMNPDKFISCSTVPALEGKSWNTLCIVGKRLLLRNSEQAVCMELP